MDTTHFISKFEKIGARAAIRPLVRNRWRPQAGPVVIDVGRDRHGEFFDIGRQTAELPLSELEVVGKENRQLVADYSFWFWNWH